jgi:hypothetical protein
MRTANVLMSVMLSDKLTDQDKKELFAKIQNPEAYCSSAGCMLPRKPKHPKFPQSRYCIHHAKIAKAEAEFRGMYQNMR